MLGHKAGEESGEKGVFGEIDGLSNVTIVDISMSSTHVLCSNAKGEVFAWGKNIYQSPNGTLPGVLGPTGKECENLISVMIYFCNTTILFLGSDFFFFK